MLVDLKRARLLFMLTGRRRGMEEKEREREKVQRQHLARGSVSRILNRCKRRILYTDFFPSL